MNYRLWIWPPLHNVYRICLRVKAIILHPATLFVHRIHILMTNYAYIFIKLILLHSLLTYQ